MFGAIFYVYKKEVQKMNDLIELKLITREDAECLHKLQIEAFMPLYEKYQDDATSPAKESLETITKKIVDDNSDFYFILFSQKCNADRNPFISYYRITDKKTFIFYHDSRPFSLESIYRKNKINVFVIVCYDTHGKTEYKFVTNIHFE